VTDAGGARETDPQGAGAAPARAGGQVIGGRPDEKPDKADRSKWAKQDEDVRLMLAFRDGDADAFRRLVERNQAKVYAMIFRVIPDHAQVEDLTQEVFLRVFRTAKRYRPLAKFSTWLYRIAANVALNAIRAQRKIKIGRLDLPGDEDGWRRHHDVPDKRLSRPHTRLDTEELQRKLNEAIAGLPENQRIAIVLNKYEHMSYQEIADILDCSSMAVKSLLSRARCNLRDSLARYLGSEFARNLPNP